MKLTRAVKLDIDMRLMLSRLRHEEFESSTACTPEFATFARLFTKVMTAFFKTELGADKVKLHRGHFEVSGFMHCKLGWWYINTGDLRGRSMDSRMLLRRALDDRDCRGGVNMWVDTESPEVFKTMFKSLVLRQ